MRLIVRFLGTELEKTISTCNFINTQLKKYATKRLKRILFTDAVDRSFLTEITFGNAITSKKMLINPWYMQDQPYADLMQNSQNWDIARKECILTASQIPTALDIDPFSNRISFLRRKVYPQVMENYERTNKKNAIRNAALSHGKTHENDAKLNFLKMMKDPVNLYDVGLFVMFQGPFCFGASPDGILKFESEDALIEVKCPYIKGLDDHFRKGITNHTVYDNKEGVWPAMDTKSMPGKIKNENLDPKFISPSKSLTYSNILIPDHHYVQIQMQMHYSHLKCCYYSVYVPTRSIGENNASCVKVCYDFKFCEYVQSRLLEFAKLMIYNRICFSKGVAFTDYNCHWSPSSGGGDEKYYFFPEEVLAKLQIVERRSRKEDSEKFPLWDFNYQHLKSDLKKINDYIMRSQEYNNTFIF